MDERVTLPYEIGYEIGDKFSGAKKLADKMTQFAALSNSAFEALEGLLANWPSTETIGKYEPDPHRPVLMKDKALEQAADVIRKYRALDGDFTW